MGSLGGNRNPWAPYDTFRDCSHGLCSIYCPQWCYIIFPPPPPPPLFHVQDQGSIPDLSPLLIALIGILATAFVLVSYYTLISKFCRHRRDNSVAGEQRGHYTWRRNRNPTAGLDEALIKSIAVYKYKKNDGFVDCTDCSVCLSEFEENEGLRLLPKCSHAFHVPCIDTWLKSHSNCPLCRTDIADASNTASAADQTVAEARIAAGGSHGTEINVSALQYLHRSGDSVLGVEDLETGSRNETVVTVDVVDGGGGGGSPPKPPDQRSGNSRCVEGFR